MKLKITLCIVSALLLTSSIFAQSTKEKDEVKFKGHWFLQVQGGAAYTLGEGDFSKLISPAAALSVGYQFSPAWGLRAGLSGWESKGAWVSPRSVYKFNYLQANLDAMLDLANLFGRFNPMRTVNPYVFAGVGLNGAFKNGEANELNNQGYDMGNIWSGHKIFFAGRLGLGVNFRLSNCVLLGVELNSNMLSDKYNSKKAGNIDWQFNALAGLTFRFGKTYKKCPAAAAVPMTPITEPKPEPTPEPEAAPVVEKPAAPAVEAKAAALREEVYFRIGASEVSAAEESKIATLAEYLKANPKAEVEVTGYADAATGSHAINQKISQQRAESVAAALTKAGIEASRIRIDAKGDTVQPFAGVEKNRVAICIAE